MKVLVITHKTSRLSGAPRRIKELIEGMQSKKWEIAELNITFSNQPNMVLRFFARLLELTSSFLRLMMAHKEFCPEVVVVFTPPDGFITLFYRRFHRNTKIVYCDRADPMKGVELQPIEGRIDYVFRPVELALIKYLEKTICLECDGVIFNSEARRAEIQKRAKRQILNARIIRNNANPSWVLTWLSELSSNEAELTRIKSFFEGKKIIGFVGNLYEIGNGLDILLTTFRLVSAVVPEAVLIIVGDGPDKEKLKKKVADLNLNNMVHFTGWVHNPLLYAVNFDVLVQPSRHHSSPNSVLEALMCGIPVLGSRVGGIPEILEYEEFLFESEDAQELSEKIVAIITGKIDPLFVKSLVLSLREKYIFDWQERMIAAIELLSS